LNHFKVLFLIWSSDSILFNKISNRWSYLGHFLGEKVTIKKLKKTICLNFYLFYSTRLLWELATHRLFFESEPCFPKCRLTKSPLTSTSSFWGKIRSVVCKLSIMKCRLTKILVSISSFKRKDRFSFNIEYETIL